MKKTLYTLSFLFVAVCVFFNLNKKSQVSVLPPIVNKGTNEASPQLQEANVIETVSNASPVTISQPTNIIEASKPMNALAATNLEQWKSILPELKYSDNFLKWDSWVMQHDRKTGIPVMLGVNGQAVNLNVWFADVDVLKDGQIRKIEMQSSIMNIDETKALGLKLCNMLGVDPKDFLVWCDKVGNHWLDAPLYATGSKAYGIQILHTFDDERPWLINFIIDHPQAKTK